MNEMAWLVTYIIGFAFGLFTGYFWGKAVSIKGTEDKK